tara:strand:- start:16599 stop:17657 length:1059 start_codon:yes stop_codon:yes gene_type:complete
MKTLIQAFFLIAVILVSCKEVPSKKEHDPIVKTNLNTIKAYPTFGFVERLDPALDALVPKDAKIELVAEGFTWSEGPVWLPQEKTLLFSDVPENKVYKWNETDGLRLYIQPSGYTGPEVEQSANWEKGSNGLILNPEGDLLLCQHGNRGISKLVSLKDSLHPKFEPIVANYQGKRFNSPNDLTYDQNGNLYFTDPSYGLGNQKSELGFNGVYFFNKKSGVILLDNTIKNPNGLAISHDNKTLYVCDSNVDFPKILVFDMVGEGKITNKRVFFDATELRKASIDKQCPDGMKLDEHGNLFVAGPGGVLIISPEAKHLGTIKLDKRTGNCEFTDDGKYLFITSDDYLLRVDLKS